MTTDGGPAFPCKGVGLDNHEYLQSPGMSLRDWLAGQAIAGMTTCCVDIISALSQKPDDNEDAKQAAETLIGEVLPEMAYEIADAMLAARERKDSQ